MTFEGQYLTYLQYKGLGGTLDQTSFNLLEFEARKKIDEATQQRLKNIDSEDIPQEVKICEFKMINSIKKYGEETDKISTVSSENIDGYSVSYITTGQIDEIIKAKNDDLEELITTYLYGVIVNGEHLIYLGVK